MNGRILFENKISRGDREDKLCICMCAIIFIHVCDNKSDDIVEL
jgi:hypothetical protein